ncbi:amidohydrolase family protein [Streptomyces sp. Wb2n-11]|uniref:amidohydrolase family protein n=1 Tax=Streptomyces sp. Wb2n-11 TaxID=1030533 RepID=UPI000AFCB3A1|nr:amidohydrolase family protein [Streptomyces sp. Wb2n-11]
MASRPRSSRPRRALLTALVTAATRTDMTDAVAGAEELLPGWFQPVFLALVLLGSVTNSIITLYSSSLNLQVLGIPWSRSRTILISAAVTASGSLRALFFADFTESLLSFLSLLIIVFAPWGGVFLADMLLRRGPTTPRPYEAGAVLAFSSDWNVAEMDPMAGICTAVTRRPLGGGEPWMPGETVDVETAVHGYTMGSAYANFLEDERGSLTVGKLADFVVLSRDILAVAPDDIPGTVAETVVVGGEVVVTAS